MTDITDILHTISDLKSMARAADKGKFDRLRDRVTELAKQVPVRTEQHFVTNPERRPTPSSLRQDVLKSPGPVPPGVTDLESGPTRTPHE